MMKYADPLDILHGLVLEDGRRWGEAAVSWQRADAAALLDRDAPQRRHWLGRSRGGSKTSDAAGITLAAMLTQLPDGANAYAAAADRDQAALLVDALAGYANRTPGLEGQLDVQTWKVVAPRGVSLTVLASDGSSAYGLRGPWWVLDELCQWSDAPSAHRFYEAVTTAWPKTPTARVAIITTAGDPTHFSHKVYETALAEPDLWRVSMVDGPPPWLPKDLIEAERRRLPDSAFERLWMNHWAAAEDRLVTPDDLAACTVLDGALAPLPGRQYVVTLDVGLTNDRTVMVVAHAEPVSVAGESATRVIVDRIVRWHGTKTHPVDLTEVEDTVYMTTKTYWPAAVVVDPYQAVGLCQRLEKRGVDITTYTFSSASVGRLAASLFTLLRQHLISLPKDEELIDELSRVRLRDNGAGSFRLDHADGDHDDQAVALALATHHLLNAEVGSYAQQYLNDLAPLCPSCVRPSPWLGRWQGTPRPSECAHCGADLEHASPPAAA